MKKARMVEPSGPRNRCKLCVACERHWRARSDAGPDRDPPQQHAAHV